MFRDLVFGAQGFRFRLGFTASFLRFGGLGVQAFRIWQLRGFRVAQTQTDRQTDRQTDGQRNKQKQAHKDTQTHRHAQTETHIDTTHTDT